MGELVSDTVLEAEMGLAVAVGVHRVQSTVSPVNDPE